MTRRLLPLLAVLVLAGCSYESSGTTTTTVPLDDQRPAPTSPVDLVAEDQKSEGSSLVVSSVSLPAPGWVVARLDEGGSPGEVVGVSLLLQTGVSTEVTVPFLLPIAETTRVHLAVHIDVDQDGSFQYQPPDGFIDEIGTRANGDPAVTTVTVALLPPLQPGDAFLDPQVSDGSSVVIAGGLLPAPGFMVLHRADGDLPGEILGVSGLLAGGSVGELTITLDPPLQTGGSFMVVAWVDRDENGGFTPGDDGDAMAVRDDGVLAAGTAEITVVSRQPAELTVSDQESEDDEFRVARVVMPSPGFIEILSSVAGSPGVRLAVVPVGAGTLTDAAIDLPVGVSSGATLWLRLWIDYDRDSALSAADLTALDDAGEPVVASFVVTIG